jgi:UDP-glucose 4-epimerase
MKNNNKNFFITGAMGFIGSHWCEYLLRKGYNVIGLDLDKWYPKLLQYDNFHFIQDTVKNLKVVEQCINECDCICHFAAIAEPKTYVDSPAKVIEITAKSGMDIINLCRLKNKLVFFTSTSEIYGKSMSLPFKENGDRLLGDTNTNRWCYSSSKAILEHYLHACASSNELKYVTVRLFNVYGPRLKGRVVANFLNSVVHNEPIVIHNDGRQTRSFTYVDDVLQAFDNLISNQNCYNKIFNVGNPVETSINDFAQTVIKVSDRNIPIEYQTYQDYYGDSYEDIPRRVPDISKLQEHTGWAPKISLEEGLRKTLDYIWNEKHEKP